MNIIKRLIVFFMIFSFLFSCAVFRKTNSQQAPGPAQASITSNPPNITERPPAFPENPPASVIMPVQFEAQDAGTMSLDTALLDFSVYAAAKIPEKSLTALANIQAPVHRLGSYIAEKLAESLLNDSSLRIISHQDYERIFLEQNLQASLYFNDETTAKLGRVLGWQTIILGVVEPLSNAYLLSLRAVNVETGEIQGSRNYMLNSRDPVLLNIINPSIEIQRLEERESMLTPFNGDQNDFELNISINKAVYYDGEFLYISLLSNADCYFVAYHLDIDNKMQVIYPNIFESNTNFLTAGKPRTIPENSYYLLHAPYGEERILVYASERPIIIPEEQYQARSITREYLEDPDALWRGGGRGLSVRSGGATVQIGYTILPK